MILVNIKIVELLKELGLTQNEAQVFIALYQKSPQIATNLATGAKVSRGRIYEILQSLEDYGLIISNRIKGGSNHYSLTDYPTCLNRFKEAKVGKIEGILEEVTSFLDEIERTDLSASLLTTDDFSVIKGEKSNEYYIEQILDKSKKSVLTNFTADMLIEHKRAIMNTKKRGISFTFLISDSDFENPEVKEIVRGSKLFVLSIEDMPSPIITVFKDARPSMIIIDDNEIAIIRFYKQTADSLMIRNPELIKYQRFILDLFMQGGEEIDYE